MVLNTTFNNMLVISWAGYQLYWWGKPDDPEKTTDLSLRRLLKYDVNISLLYKDGRNVIKFKLFPSIVVRGVDDGIKMNLHRQLFASRSL
jgi:hypothetical protein